MPLDKECACCGMLCAPLDFHPFAACLMFKACGNGNTVRANLDFIFEYAKRKSPNEVTTALA